MSIGERIKQIRKENKLTLEKFGAYLKISPQSVSKLERGVSNPSDQTVFLICREFHINEEWLRTGEGEPHQAAYQDSLWEIVQSRGLDSADYALISGIMDMPAEVRKALITAIVDIADKVKRGEPLTAIPTMAVVEPVEQEQPEEPAEEESDLSEEEIEARVANYRDLLKREQRMRRQYATERLLLGNDSETWTDPNVTGGKASSGSAG